MIDANTVFGAAPAPPADADARIAEATEITRFLSHPGVQRALITLNREYFDNFRRPQATADERTQVWAKTQALADLVTELQRVVQSGEIAKIQKSQADRKAEASRKYDRRTR